jgi:hypothetical protein
MIIPETESKLMVGDLPPYPRVSANDASGFRSSPLAMARVDITPLTGGCDDFHLMQVLVLSAEVAV